VAGYLKEDSIKLAVIRIPPFFTASFVKIRAMEGKRWAFVISRLNDETSSVPNT
jgi:hypothetical protein